MDEETLAISAAMEDQELFRGEDCLVLCMGGTAIDQSVGAGIVRIGLFSLWTVYKVRSKIVKTSVINTSLLYSFLYN